MFKSELEFLYSGEGMGEMVEWLNNDKGDGSGGLGGLFGFGIGGGDGSGSGSGGGAQWGTIEGPEDGKRERLREDLVYMWRSKLYSDVKIILPLTNPHSSATNNRAAPTSTLLQRPPEDTHSDDPSSSTETATFSSHKFILASRSPYFAQLLLNTGGFKPSDRDEIELPSPPFTPASLHFCLGYM
jgi:hypothetical protein